MCAIKTRTTIQPYHTNGLYVQIENNHSTGGVYIWLNMFLYKVMFNYQMEIQSSVMSVHHQCLLHFEPSQKPFVGQLV